MYTLKNLNQNRFLKASIIIVLLLFGGKKIPELMKGLGKGMKEFKKAKTEMDEEESGKTESEKIEK